MIEPRRTDAQPGRVGSLASDPMPRRSATVSSRPAFDQLRESLTQPSLSLSAAAEALVRAALPHAHSTRAWTRVYGIDKMLAWKLLQIRDATEVSGVVGHLPGRSGVHVIARRLRAGGCPEEPVAAFEHAAIGLWDLLKDAHVDRSTLSTLAAGSLDSAEEVRARRRDRRSLRASHERLWGIGAARRTTTYLLAPSRTEGMIDLALAGTIEGLRVLRRGEPWCILTPSFNFETPPSDLDAPPPGSEVSSKAPDASGPLDRTDPMEPLLSSLCDEIGRRAIVRHPTSGTRHLYLDPSTVPLGKPFRIAVGEYTPRLGEMEAASPGELAMINSRILTTVKTLSIEILIHRDVTPPASDPTALGFMAIDPAQRRPFEKPLRIPLDAEFTPVPIGSLVRGDDEAAAARRSLLELAAARLRADLADFTAHRIVIADPPLGSTVSIRWRLPTRA